MRVSRRDLLAGAAGVVALGKSAMTQAPPAPADSTKVRGKPSRALGQRAPTEKPLRQPRGATSSGTPHQDLYGTITPSDLHFERHHGGVPDIDPASYSLLIHGMVERPMVFTLADLKRFPPSAACIFSNARATSAAAAPPPISPAADRRPDEHQRMDGRSAGDAVPRSWREPESDVVPPRPGRRGAHAQHSGVQGATTLHRVRTER